MAFVRGGDQIGYAQRRSRVRLTAEAAAGLQAQASQLLLAEAEALPGTVDPPVYLQSTGPLDTVPLETVRHPISEGKK
jgi:hypothetical protein